MSADGVRNGPCSSWKETKLYRHIEELRLKFASFLDRLADGASTASDWDTFIVAHYRDDFLESIRRCVVRLMQNQLGVESESEQAKQALKAWALAVRYESNTPTDNQVEHQVEIRVSRDEGCVT